MSTHTHAHTPGHFEKVDEKLRAQTLSSSLGVHLRREHGAHLVVVGKERTHPLSILRPALGVNHMTQVQQVSFEQGIGWILNVFLGNKHIMRYGSEYPELKKNGCS